MPPWNPILGHLPSILPVMDTLPKDRQQPDAFEALCQAHENKYGDSVIYVDMWPFSARRCPRPRRRDIQDPAPKPLHTKPAPLHHRRRHQRGPPPVPTRIRDARWRTQRPPQKRPGKSLPDRGHERVWVLHSAVQHHPLLDTGPIRSASGRSAGSSGPRILCTRSRARGGRSSTGRRIIWARRWLCRT